MGMLLKEILDIDALQALISNLDSASISRQGVDEAARELITAIKSLTLYPNHQLLIDRFEPLRKEFSALYAHRTFYVWQITQAAFEFTSLNLPDAELLQSNSLKCQVSFVSVLYDDICDLGRDRTLFDKSVLALRGQISQDDKVELYKLISDTWSTVQNTIKHTPNYALLKSVLDEAYQEWISSFEYSISTQETSNFDTDWEKYVDIISHTSILYLAGLIDLLFVPNLLEGQVSSASKVFLRTQKMGQIANWLTTWPRELMQQDFTSGVFRMALENKWITWDDLRNSPREKIREQIRQSPAEEQLWQTWERLRVESHQIVRETQLPALNGYVDGFSALMFLLIASAGTKLI